MKPFPKFYLLRAARFPWSLMITSLVLLATSASCSQGREESHTQPFGVFLGLETAKLWDEVEARYGQSVRTEFPPELEANAAAIVTDAGTPVIRIRESVAPTEVRIANELLHLKMVSEGFAYSIEPRFSSGSVTPENLALFRRTAEVVHNGILHWMFYPQLRSMGMNPSEELGGQLAETFLVKAAAAYAMTERNLALNFLISSRHRSRSMIP